MKKVIQGGTIINEGQQFQADLVIEGGKITQILAQAPETLLQEAQVIDASHCFVIPGVIDDQVHFREPGLTHKGNIGEGSRAAAAGGVTSFMDMPNVVPPTTTLQLLEEKQEIAGRTSLVNYSFYLGATTDNIGEIKRVNPRTTCGIKAFMGSSTGNMLIDSIPALERLFAESPLLIATHCEDTPTINHNLALYKAKYGDDIPPQYHPLIRSREACLKSSALAASLARKYNSRLHILHLSTADELTLLDSGKRLEKKITGEACVHHLWFNDEAYLTKGNFVKWNPAIKTEADRQALLEAVNQGVIDVIATDHAPHTLFRKKRSIHQSRQRWPYGPTLFDGNVGISRTRYDLYGKNSRRHVPCPRRIVPNRKPGIYPRRLSGRSLYFPESPLDGNKRKYSLSMWLVAPGKPNVHL